MTRAIAAAALVAMLVPAPARAGWFGPSSASECAAEYAARAGTIRLVGYARQQCAVAFDRTVTGDARDYALCMAKGISQLRVEQGIHLVRAQCRADDPPPSCTAGSYYEELSGKCARRPP